MCEFLNYPVKKKIQLAIGKNSFLKLAAKTLAGLAPEVNQRNPLHADAKAHKWRIHPGFETHGRCYQKSKTGIWVAPQQGLMPSKFLFF